MKRLLQWRLRRAERALALARGYRDAWKFANERYEGVYTEEVVDAELAERELETAVNDLRRRLGLEVRGAK